MGLNNYIKLIIVIVFMVLIVFIPTKLGIFLDVTEEPREVDLIVSLGGDYGPRIKKTLTLYENDLSKSKKIILTGIENFDNSMKIYELDWRVNYLVKKGIKINNIVFNAEAKNTLEETIFIKRFMLQNNFKSVMFITDAPHSRRIDFFASKVLKYEDSGISFIVVASDNNWWNSNTFYMNNDGIIFAINELTKLSYYYIKYLQGNINEK